MRSYNGMRLEGGVREQRPVWPRRPGAPVRWGEGSPGVRRWLRDPEPFEARSAWEGYPGATVLDDLAGDDEDSGRLRVLARYTVVRLLVLSGGRMLPGPKLHTERRVALEHLALVPAADWERRALERLAHVCRHQPTPEMVLAACAPAESAGQRGHLMGAFALYRAAYEIAVHETWWGEAAVAAAGVARLAGMYEAPRSRRVWEWRARVLRAREARAVAAAVAAARAEEDEARGTKPHAADPRGSHGAEREGKL